MNKLKEYLEKHDEARILDIATGPGSFIAVIMQLSDSFSEIIGIDHQEKAVEAAGKNFQDTRISFTKMDIDDMTFDEKSFDIVCLSNSLHHMNDINDAIDKMVRMVKPGGILVFNEMIRDNEDDRQMTHTYFHHFWAEINRTNGIVHKETMTRREIFDTLNGHHATNLMESWEMESPETEEIPPEAVGYLKGTLDKSLESVKDHPDYEKFAKRADELKTRLDNVGFASATQILTVLQVR